MENSPVVYEKKKAAPTSRGLFSPQERKKASVKLTLLLGTLFLLAGAVVVMLPVLWMVLGAFKTPSEIYSTPQAYWPSSFGFGNFVTAFKLVPLDRYFLNSLFICACVVVGQLLVSSMAAYALTKLRVRFATGI